METTVGDEKCFTARYLAIDDAAHIDTGFAHQVASQFQDHARARKTPLETRQPVTHRFANGLEIERIFAREIWDAETAAKIDERGGRLEGAGQPRSQISALPLCLNDGWCVKALGAPEHVKAG